MAAESERRRDDLAALRIDRSAPPVRERPPWWGYAWIGAASALFLLLCFFVWRATLGRVAEVDVAYAQVSGQGGAATPAAVLTGSGYVVTGDRYISLGGVGFSAVTFTTNVIALRVGAFDLAWAALLSAVIGLIGGWFPALRAARLRPVEALRRA